MRMGVCPQISTGHSLWRSRLMTAYPSMRVVSRSHPWHPRRFHRPSRYGNLSMPRSMAAFLCASLSIPCRHWSQQSALRQYDDPFVALANTAISGIEGRNSDVHIIVFSPLGKTEHSQEVSATTNQRQLTRNTRSPQLRPGRRAPALPQKQIKFAVISVDQ